MNGFDDLIDRIKQSGKSHTLTVRDLLRYFGQERRGKHVAAEIEVRLQKEKLETAPSFNVVHIDTPIELRLKAAPTKLDAKSPEASKTEAPGVNMVSRELALLIRQRDSAATFPSNSHCLLGSITLPD